MSSDSLTQDPFFLPLVSGGLFLLFLFFLLFYLCPLIIIAIYLYRQNRHNHVHPPVFQYRSASTYHTHPGYLWHYWRPHAYPAAYSPPLNHHQPYAAETTGSGKFDLESAIRILNERLAHIELHTGTATHAHHHGSAHRPNPGSFTYENHPMRGAAYRGGGGYYPNYESSNEGDGSESENEQKQKPMSDEEYYDSFNYGTYYPRYTPSQQSAPPPPATPSPRRTPSPPALNPHELSGVPEAGSSFEGAWDRHTGIQQANFPAELQSHDVGSYSRRHRGESRGRDVGIGYRNQTERESKENENYYGARDGKEGRNKDRGQFGGKK